jgi:predicted SnoaL-like aldol condensation-catalyzing enzyme
VGDTKKNKETVRGFYELVFNDKQPKEAAAKYIGPKYIQHNPQAPDGPDAFIQFVTGWSGQFPQLSVEIKRMVAEGDVVVTHGVLKASPEDRGTAAADIFRLEDGKIVEHWDVLQPVPDTAANDNTMF